MITTEQILLGVIVTLGVMAALAIVFGLAFMGKDHDDDGDEPQ
jgi:hypothetical protein